MKSTETARRTQPFGAAGEMELLTQRALVGAQGNVSLQSRRIGFLAGAIAALALTDAEAGFHER